MQPLFVGWQDAAPGDRALTYAPEEFECSRPASLADVRELADAGFGEIEENCFVENVATGDEFELQEGIFTALWAPKAIQPEEYFLFLVDARTGEQYEVW